MENLTFRLPEVLSLIGLVQCVYILVYMVFRAGNLRQAFWPFVYFLVIACGFFLDFAQRILGGGGIYGVGQWAVWFAGPLLAVALIVRVAGRPLSVFYGMALLFLPLSFLLAQAMAAADDECRFAVYSCAVFHQWLVIGGLVSGAVAMLSLWLRRGMLGGLRRQPGGEARFWLVMTLLLMNGAFLGTMLWGMTVAVEATQIIMIRTIIGLGLVYLAGTCLFRIYPFALKTAPRVRDIVLNGAEEELLRRIQSLLDREKVYQEPSYSRSDLARELGAAESVVSRIINAHFGKSVPQLLNEYRIADAQRLLRETAAPVRQIAEESGFHSAATFNRVFREVTGRTPTAYRQEAKTEDQLIG